MGLFDLRCPEHGFREDVFRKTSSGVEVDGATHYECGAVLDGEDEQHSRCSILCKPIPTSWGGAIGVLFSNAEVPQLGLTLRDDAHRKQVEREHGGRFYHKDEKAYLQKKEKWKDKRRSKKKDLSKSGPGRIKSVTPVKLGA